MDEKSEVKKKYRTGGVEDDPSDPYALVVHYDVEEYARGDGESPQCTADSHWFKPELSPSSEKRLNVTSI